MEDTIIVDIHKTIIISEPLEETITFFKSFNKREIALLVSNIKELRYIKRFTDFIKILNRMKIDVILDSEYEEDIIECNYVLVTLDEFMHYFYKNNKKMIFRVGVMNSNDFMNGELGINNLISNLIPTCVIEDYLYSQNMNDVITINYINRYLCCTTTLDGIIFIKPNKEIYFVDIDETICSRSTGLWYNNAKPWYNNIDKINKLYDEGHTIVYWTARGTLTGLDHYNLTKSQLEQWNAKHHLLKVKKPYYDKFIDDKSINMTYKLEID